MDNKILIEQALYYLFPAIILIDMIWYWSKRSNRQKAYLEVRRGGIQALKTMSWQDFERFCGLHFESKGYRVQLCGLGGADGGIDLLLRKRGKTTMVQCKHWKSRVSVMTVREMFGIMHANRYDAVIIVALSGYTREAQQWAAGKPISLLSGVDLIK
ncbi:restriction endonuclease [Pseudomonas putida]|uniref:Restriction endonuclease n=1 Tax=Pseudomonas putida TaxID=303 RepID=A0A8I1EC27_PSEPU|nr:restriction endonuclease [Pseudomonas putida]MBI6882916.1 restriction endonuclease [Pseudomonas putida]